MTHYHPVRRRPAMEMEKENAPPRRSSYQIPFHFRAAKTPHLLPYKRPPPPLSPCTPSNKIRTPLADLGANGRDVRASGEFGSAISSCKFLLADDDDVIDDAFLAEVDAICEQQSAIKYGDAILAEVDTTFKQESVVQDAEWENVEDRFLSDVDATGKQQSVVRDPVRKDDENEFLAEVDAICEQQSMLKGDEREEDDGMFLAKVDTVCLQQSMADDVREEEEEEGRSASLMEDNAGGLGNQALWKYEEYLSKLSEAQREAACSDIMVPLMIVAGPGSGKTSTMVGRVLWLLKKGIRPCNILAMTFTTAAAAEMRERIAKVVGKVIAKDLSISTFHSFCLQLCRSHADKLGRTSEFLIYGHGQQRRAVIEAIRLAECGKSDSSDQSTKHLNAETVRSYKDKSKKWQKFVTQAKASGRTSEEIQKAGDLTGAVILQHYNEILKSCNALDYHDFISSATWLLTEFSEVYKVCQDTWRAVVVDEFQDTSSMQYRLLKIIASHKCFTIVGDEDQSIFSFNGADTSGFDSFRKDFPSHKEVRLCKNYRSTRAIVEAATSLIQNNCKVGHLKFAQTDNPLGCNIIVKECHSEDAQCAYVVDKILESVSGSVDNINFGNIAVLYRRQVSGKTFQLSFRNRRIPFNIHGVAFYRKKVIKAIMAILRTILPGCEDGPARQAFKVLLPGDKEEKKKVVDFVEKIAFTRACSFLAAARDIFSAKISGTFKRAQLTQGRKVLSILDSLSRLAQKEESISVVISSAADVIPQKYLLEKRAVVDADGGKLLNEDDDPRSVIEYLKDDIADFLSSCNMSLENSKTGETGCHVTLKAFVDFITLRATENFRLRKQENQNSVTLTTIHQSKGLEWDIVFIVQANDSEIPLLHEYSGHVNEGNTNIEEERRLFYVAMTRARKRLHILHVTVDHNRQLLQPSRFLKEIPVHLLEIQGERSFTEKSSSSITYNETECSTPVKRSVHSYVEKSPVGVAQYSPGNDFLKRFEIDDRSVISHIFHHWAKKQAFQQPKRLLDKIGFVIDERLRSKGYKRKDVLSNLKSCLAGDEAFAYAQYVIQWEQIPVDQRNLLSRERQEHFQKQRIEAAMGSSEPTSKQISYLRNLGCTITPTSRLHASNLIEQYKKL